MLGFWRLGRGLDRGHGDRRRRRYSEQLPFLGSRCGTNAFCFEFSQVFASEYIQGDRQKASIISAGGVNKNKRIKASDSLGLEVFVSKSISLTKAIRQSDLLAATDTPIALSVITPASLRCDQPGRAVAT